MLQVLIFNCIMHFVSFAVFAVNFRVVTMDAKFLPLDQMVRADYEQNANLLQVICAQFLFSSKTWLH